MSSNDRQPDDSVIHAPVSFGNEELILVDSDDVALGYDSKISVHSGSGRLHRAFSAFLFDDQQRLLVHRRSEKKPLWPGYWTNSCCSHPRRDESLDDAVHRRIREELGVEAQINRVYQFEYCAGFEQVGTEHELCHVYLAERTGSRAISAHADEVMEWRWVSIETVDEWTRERSEQLTPWFLLEWAALRSTYSVALDGFLRAIKNNRSVA